MSSSTGFLIGAGFIAIVSIPLILKVVPRNSLYGFRTPSTLSSDEVWFRANHFAGWALFIAAVVSTALLVTVPGSARPNTGYDALLFSGPIVVALIASFIYLRHINRGRVGEGT
jgi:uncharacterized membrane protein